jgi:mutator protein MutT
MSGDRRVEVALAVVRQGDRVLIGQRPAGGPLAGYWEFPGGKILSGESPQDAAARECREETGLQICVGSLLSLVDHVYPHGPVRLHFFAAEPRCPPRPSVGAGAVRGSPDPAPSADPPYVPVAPFRWVPLADLPSYRFPPANTGVIQRMIADSQGPA